MKIPISPVFLKALAIDLLIIFATLTLIAVFVGFDTGSVLIMILVVYAIIHIALEAVGIG